MESYQTLNRELVLSVRDLRKENVELRNLVTNLTAENMRISSEYSELRRCATNKFTKISEILGSVAQDLFPETSKKPVQDERTRKRYTMMSESATASGSLPRSSPEKMPRKLATSNVNVGRRRGGEKAREAAAAVPEDADDFDTSDMSIEDIRDWLKSDQIEIPAPVTEDPVENQFTEEEAEISEEVPENQEQIYKNMTTIVEENSKSISHSSLQVTQITRFAASTPHSTRIVTTEASRMELSPIASSEGDQRCLFVNGGKREKIFARRSPGDQVSGETSVTLVLPKSVTVRRREKFVQELTPEESEESKESSPEKPETPPTPKEEPKDKVTKRTQRKRLAVWTNWTENSPEEPKEPSPEKPKEESEEPKEPTPPTPKEEPKDKVTKRTQRKRRADMPNWSENSPEEPKEPSPEEPKEESEEPTPPTPKEEPKNKVTKRTQRKRRADWTNWTENSPEEPKEPSPEKPKGESEEPKEPTLNEEPKSKRTKRTQRKRLADRTNWTEHSQEEPPKPIKVENLEDDIVPRSQRPRRQAAPRNLCEPSLNEKLRRE